MHGQLVSTATSDGGTGTPTANANPTHDGVIAALRSGAHFWLDLTDIDDEVLALLRDDFGFHPLAVEDAEHFGQRPKIESYDDFVLVVAYGVSDQQAPIEAHCFVSDRFVVTVHRAPVPAWDAIRTTLTHQRAPLPSPTQLLHLLWDALADSYFPVLDSIDDAIDHLQDDILARPTDAQLGTLFDLKRQLISTRKLASEQRDMVATLFSGNQPLPGMTSDVERYFRDLYDHLVRISQTADSYRDLLSSALDTHLSVTSNRLNVVMKQLAIIATVFLPMSFLTGFFGQNFGWMVDRIGGAWVFWTAGVGLQLVVAAALLLMFRRMGWLGASAD